MQRWPNDLVNIPIYMKTMSICQKYLLVNILGKYKGIWWKVNLMTSRRARLIYGPA